MPTLCHQHHNDPATQPRDGCEQTGARHDLRHGLHSALSAHGLHVTVSLTIAPPVQLPGVSCSCCRCPHCPRAPVNHVSPAPRFADAANAGVQTCAVAPAAAPAASTAAAATTTAAAAAVDVNNMDSQMTTTAVAAAVNVNDKQLDMDSQMTTTATAAVNVNDTDSPMTTTAAAAAVVANDDDSTDSQETTDSTPSPVPLRRHGDDQDEDEWERQVSSPVLCKLVCREDDSSPVLCTRLEPCDEDSSRVLCKRLLRRHQTPAQCS